MTSQPQADSDLAGVYASWLAELEEDHQIGIGRGCRPTTLVKREQYGILLLRTAYALVGPEDPTVGVLTREFCRRYVAFRVRGFGQEGTPGSSRKVKLCTVSKEVSNLRRFCRWLQQEGLLDKDPLVGISIAGSSKPMPVALSTEVVEQVMALLLPERQLYLLLAFSLGCRTSEVEGLTWRDLNLDGGSVHIRGTKSATSDRQAPLPAGTLVDWLRSLHPGQEHLDEPIVRRWSNRGRVFARIRASLGIPVLNIKTMRSTFTTNAALAGVNIVLVAKVLGHADTKTTSKYYTDFSVAALRPVADAVPKLRTVS